MILDPGCPIQDPGSWTLDPDSDPGSQALDTGSKILDPKSRPFQAPQTNREEKTRETPMTLGLQKSGGENFPQTPHDT